MKNFIVSLVLVTGFCFWSLHGSADPMERINFVKDRVLQYCKAFANKYIENKYKHPEIFLLSDFMIEMADISGRTQVKKDDNAECTFRSSDIISRKPGALYHVKLSFMKAIHYASIGNRETFLQKMYDTAVMQHTKADIIGVGVLYYEYDDGKIDEGEQPDAVVYTYIKDFTVSSESEKYEMN